MDHNLSIIIPAYNAEKYIRQCIESIIRQTFSQFELIVVDDGSSDSTPEILDEYVERDSRIRAIHKERGGVSSARNLGIEMARGDLIAFVDADDILDLDMYRILIDNLDATQSDISACGYKVEMNPDQVISDVPHNDIPQPLVFSGKEIYISMTRKDDSIEGLVWNKVWKRSIIGNHRYRTDVAIVDDAVFTWETVRDANIVCFCNLPLYHYLYIETSITRKSSMEKYMKALYGCEILMDDAKLIADSCYTDLSLQYINWNITVFENLLGYDGNDKPQLYAKIVNNMRSKKEYWRKLSLIPKIQVYAITFNYTCGKAIIAFKRSALKVKRRFESRQIA